MDIRIGNAPCSWGVLEFGLEGDAAGYERVLDEMVETGYEGTELGDWGFMPTEPGALAGALSRRRLSLLGAFVPVALKNESAQAAGTEVALKTARLLRDTSKLIGESDPFLVLADDNGRDPVRTANAGRVTAAIGLKDAEWAVFASGADQIARAVRSETGLQTVFHHHCGGYVETPHEIARLLSMTDPEALGLVFDTGHYAYGAGDCDRIPEALERFGDRIWYIHFKDCQPEVAARARSGSWDYFEAVRNGVFCELGKGGVDFASVVEWLRSRKYQGWAIVEQDVLPGMGAPRESARRNREYLKSLGL